jgi:hypothetical protein
LIHPRNGVELSRAPAVPLLGESLPAASYLTVPSSHCARPHISCGRALRRPS